jgi:hypothetical protein
LALAQRAGHDALMSAQQYLGLFIVAVGAGILLAAMLAAIIRRRAEPQAGSSKRPTSNNWKHRIAALSLAGIASFFAYLAIWVM